MTTNNQLLVPNVEAILEQMKVEIAQELGIEYGAETSARDNGRIGGEMTKRLVRMGQQLLVNEHQGYMNQQSFNQNQLH